MREGVPDDLREEPWPRPFLLFSPLPFKVFPCIFFGNSPFKAINHGKQTRTAPTCYTEITNTTQQRSQP